MAGSRWYLFIHQLPHQPLYLRAKIRNLLAKAGAIALKNSVYVLPRREAALAALERIGGEVRTGGGEAFVCSTDFVAEGTEEAVLRSFRAGRDGDYQALAAQLRKWAVALRRRSGARPPEGRLRARLVQARKRLGEIRDIDFFDAPARVDAESRLAELERMLRTESALPELPGRNADLVGRTWVTRHGVQVDRIASAWFVRRFIDPGARFRFVDPHAGETRPGEVRFDMAGGEFTHEDDRCTFETLIFRMGIRDPALSRVGEIVHDIDIKDGKFGRPEARGIERLLWGTVAANPDDEARLERGFALLDDLYQSFRRPQGGRS